jgi:hypothetical protein
VGGMQRGRDKKERKKHIKLVRVVWYGFILCPWVLSGFSVDFLMPICLYFCLMNFFIYIYIYICS